MQLLFYLFIKPLSFLPLSVLYVFSDFLHLVLYRLLGYRKKVVWQNLVQSFPEKSEKELKQIMSLFYHHFCDLMVESIRMFSISEKEAERRGKVLNPELLEELYAKGKSIIIISGHYNNWELTAAVLGLQVSYRPIGIYHKFKNDFLDDQFKFSRSRFGMHMIPKEETKSFFADHQHERNAILFGADQSPHNARKAYWMYFLGQETAVMFGSEKLAVEYNYPVVYGHIAKIKRGYYTLRFEVISENPQEEPYGKISAMHTRILEQDIKEAPQYWLWTHRRWKRTRPEDMPIHD